MLGCLAAYYVQSQSKCFEISDKKHPPPDRWGKKEGGKKKRADRSLIKKELAVTYSSAA